MSRLMHCCTGESRPALFVSWQMSFREVLGMQIRGYAYRVGGIVLLSVAYRDGARLRAGVKITFATSMHLSLLHNTGVIPNAKAHLRLVALQWIATAP